MRMCKSGALELRRHFPCLPKSPQDYHNPAACELNVDGRGGCGSEEH